MPIYIDDNFGEWDMSEEGSEEFYREIQRTNVRKKCLGCSQWVKIQPQYAYCDSCATKKEQGWDF